MPLSANQHAFLLSSFADIAEALSLHAVGREVPDHLISMYQGAGRYYHNANHLFQVMIELHKCPGPLDPYVGLALWFHDAIYDSTRDDNESRCAQLAGEYSARMKLSAEALARVRKLILATDHRNPPATGEEALIMDIDLAILGQLPEVFDDYEYSIRLEYAHVCDADFARGRAAILRRFLSQPTIYFTPHFHMRYETQAHLNLERSLKKLRD